MKEHKNQHELVDRIMKDATLASPSVDFTSKIMAQIATIKIEPTVAYKPLIPRPVLVGILSGYAALCIYLLGHQSPDKSRFDWLHFVSDFAPVLPFDWNFSIIAVDAAVLATFIVLLQVFVLKQHFARQLSSRWA